jgi:hypothetical protein
LPATTITVASIAPALVLRDDAPTASGAVRRTKIWEFAPNLHCSIIGTCLSTAELRRVLRKLGLGAGDSTDHEMHGTAVSLAGRHDKAAKLLNKALDERHRLAINQFATAHTENALRNLWCDSLRRGDIPGAYWATLTHPAATHALVRDAFGEVHMLSHLVGAANRADIQRLRQLEADNAQLRVRLDRQQVAFREAVVTRDACIQGLRHALAQQASVEPFATDDDNTILRRLVADLEHRVANEARRRAILDEKLSAAAAAIIEERSARLKSEREVHSLREELDVVETTLLPAHGDTTLSTEPKPWLGGVRVLYVGGRSHQIANLRMIAERSGATLLYHDGGVEHHLSLLAGLTSQADIVVFPVDRISHHAAQMAKQLCRQVDKLFIPLRSASGASLVAALRRPDVAKLADAAA